MQASALEQKTQSGTLGKEAGVRGTPLPILLPKYPGHDLDAHYATTRVGGDFFDALSNDERLVLLLTDIAGERHDTVHLASEVQEAFRNSGRQLLSRGDVNDADGLTMTLHEINRALMSAAGGVRCAPTFLAVYEVATGVMTYMNAGSAPAVLRDESIALLDSNGLPLGLFTHLTHDAGFTVLSAGSSLTMLSKGVLEARRGHEEFGIDRVTSIVQGEHATASQRNQALLKAAQEFQAGSARGFFGPNLHVPGFRHVNHEDQQDMTVFTLMRN